jgi:hypothetical protein
VGKWKSRVLCGISKLREKSVLWTFPRSTFSTALFTHKLCYRAVIVKLAELEEEDG